MKKVLKRQMKKPKVVVLCEGGEWFVVLDVGGDTLHLRNRAYTYREDFKRKSSAVKAAKRVAEALGVEYGGVDN